LLLRDYDALSLEERVRAIEAAERVTKALLRRDIARIKQDLYENEDGEVEIGAVFLTPRQCVEMIAQEMGADAPEVQSLLRRDEAELRLDPRVITIQETWVDKKLGFLYRYWL